MYLELYGALGGAFIPRIGSREIYDELSYQGENTLGQNTPNIQRVYVRVAEIVRRLDRFFFSVVYRYYESQKLFSMRSWEARAVKV